MENVTKVIYTNIIHDLYDFFRMVKYGYELDKKLRKRDKLSNSILEIINKLIVEDDIFKNIDKMQLYEFLYSNIDILPYDIAKEELYRRIRKIIAIEAMSKIFDGNPEQLKLFEARRNIK